MWLVEFGKNRTRRNQYYLSRFGSGLETQPARSVTLTNPDSADYAPLRDRLTSRIILNVEPLPTCESFNWTFPP